MPTASTARKSDRAASPRGSADFSASRARRLAIRRSGGYEAEIKGNYQTRGWLVDLGDAEWWKATNLRDIAADLESIAHHEIGHALIFNPANTRFAAAKLLGRLRDERLRAYLGADPTIDRSDHLPGTIDPASLHGAFGNEYHGKTPYGRWQITKVDLLCAGRRLPAARDIGLRPADPADRDPPRRQDLGALRGDAAASGGIPFYHWEVPSGSLPDGLSLDPFTGELRGTPKQAGTCEFTVRVRDYHLKGAGATRKLRMQVGID